jgi:NAD(P)-dependent dehydrogenase (short-subunit alcohol dehydrogenase family)
MSLYSRLKKNGPSGFGYGSTAEQVSEGISLAGKTFLVTGSNSGLGLETIRVLGLRGANVIAAARTEEKAKGAYAGFAGRFSPIACELSSPESVHACVASLKSQNKKLDVIVCNAGIMALPKLETAHGYELQFFTNHIGHFILVNGLLDLLSDDGRVVVLSSEAHRRAPQETIQFDNLDGKNGYEPWAAYGQSKMANILFTRQLAKRLAGTKKSANALHPGVIKTNLVRSLTSLAGVAMGIASPFVLKSIPEGTATQVYCATHPSLATVSGEYFSDCNPKKPRGDALNDATAAKLWEVSEKIVADLPRS